MKDERSAKHKASIAQGRSSLQRGFAELARSFGDLLSGAAGGGYKKEKAETKDNQEHVVVLSEDFRRLKIYIGTWNMYGKPPPAELAPFVAPPPPIIELKNGIHLDRVPRHPYHLMVFGTQECQRPISHSVLIPSKEEWERRLVDILGKAYDLVKTETMAAIHIAVFVWKPCSHLVHSALYALDESTEVTSASVPTGIAGVIGNKGGGGVSLMVGFTSFLFVNSHLT
ncbi:MAG: hypothetical protein BJ554DRAFT_6067, partial [Olpidium bornovanus]